MIIISILTMNSYLKSLYNFFEFFYIISDLIFPNFNYCVYHNNVQNIINIMTVIMIYIADIMYTFVAPIAVLNYTFLSNIGSTKVEQITSRVRKI